MSSIFVCVLKIENTVARGFILERESHEGTS